MKMSTIKFTMLCLFATAVFACKGKPKTSAAPAVEENTVTALAPTEVLEQLPVSPDGLVDAYLQVKDALVADNAAQASDAAEQFASILAQLQPAEITVEQQKSYQSLQVKIAGLIQNIISGAIEAQRESFELLSNDMVEIVAITGTSKPLYQQYCPMYKQNEGGMWLSAAEEIRNPLFGSQMLTCGVVQTTIN